MNFKDEIFEMHKKDKSHPNYNQIKKYLTHLSVCHTVIVSHSKDGVKKFNATSPDEQALVNAALYFGYRFNGRDEDNNIEVFADEEILKVELLNVIEFSSARKRMSVIIRDENN